MPGGRPPTPVPTRFWSKVAFIPFHECWEWTDTPARNGYGILKVNYKRILAHRLSYMLHYGAIPKGLMVRHVCDNRLCVRPEHLELGTALDNMRDKIDRGRAHWLTVTHCPKKHPYSGENLVGKPGARRCRTCKNATQRAYTARKRQKA